MSGLQDSLRGFLADWQFGPIEAPQALAELLQAVLASPDVVKLTVVNALAAGDLPKARALVGAGQRAIKDAVGPTPRAVAKRKKYQREYHRGYYADVVKPARELAKRMKES